MSCKLHILSQYPFNLIWVKRLMSTAWMLLNTIHSVVWQLIVNLFMVLLLLKDHRLLLGCLMLVLLLTTCISCCHVIILTGCIWPLRRWIIWHSLQINKLSGLIVESSSLILPMQINLLLIMCLAISILILVNLLFIGNRLLDVVIIDCTVVSVSFKSLVWVVTPLLTVWGSGSLYTTFWDHLIAWIFLSLISCWWPLLILSNCLRNMICSSCFFRQVSSLISIVLDLNILILYIHLLCITVKQDSPRVVNM